MRIAIRQETLRSIDLLPCCVRYAPQLKRRLNSFDLLFDQVEPLKASRRLVQVSLLYIPAPP